MDDSLRSKAEVLAGEIASQASTAEELNEMMRLMMKSALERMLNTEMDVHLGRRVLAKDATGENRLGVASSDADGSPPPAKGGKRPPNRRNGRSKKVSVASVASCRC